MRKIYSSIVLGLCLMALGISFVGNALGFWDFNLFFNGWWTLFLIIPSLLGLVSQKNYTFNFVMLLVGIILLLSAQGLIAGGVVWSVIFAAILVICGINIIISNLIFHKKISCVVKHGEIENYTAIFSGQEEKYAGESFKGANLVAVFGGIKIDLSGAIIEEDVTINITAIFGGCEIYAPQNVNVQSHSSSMLGGIENKIGYVNNGWPTIYINSSNIFGGVSIK